MLVPFHTQPAQARVWVYQSSRNLTDSEVQKVNQILDYQLQNWAAHGAALSGAVCVLHHRFVIVSVDGSQNMPSGCSIDASTHWLKQIGQQMNLDFFDRSITYLDLNNELQSIEVNKAKKAISEELITPNTLIFNNLVQNIEELNTQWQLPAQESWLKRFFVDLPQNC